MKELADLPLFLTVATLKTVLASPRPRVVRVTAGVLALRARERAQPAHWAVRLLIRGVPCKRSTFLSGLTTLIPSLVLRSSLPAAARKQATDRDPLAELAPRNDDQRGRRGANVAGGGVFRRALPHVNSPALAGTRVRQNLRRILTCLENSLTASQRRLPR
jgi:hypothetical protein